MFGLGCKVSDKPDMVTPSSTPSRYPIQLSETTPFWDVQRCTPRPHDVLNTCPSLLHSPSFPENLNHVADQHALNLRPTPLVTSYAISPQLASSSHFAPIRATRPIGLLSASCYQSIILISSLFRPSAPFAALH